MFRIVSDRMLRLAFCLTFLGLSCLVASENAKQQITKIKAGSRITVRVIDPPILIHLDQFDQNGTEIRSIVSLSGCLGKVSEDSFLLIGCQKERTGAQVPEHVIRFEDVSSIKRR